MQTIFDDSLTKLCELLLFTNHSFHTYEILTTFWENKRVVYRTAMLNILNLNVSVVLSLKIKKKNLVKMRL